MKRNGGFLIGDLVEVSKLGADEVGFSGVRRGRIVRFGTNCGFPDALLDGGTEGDGGRWAWLHMLTKIGDASEKRTAKLAEKRTAKLANDGRDRGWWALLTRPQREALDSAHSHGVTSDRRHHRRSLAALAGHGLVTLGQVETTTVALITNKGHNAYCWRNGAGA